MDQEIERLKHMKKFISRERSNVAKAQSACLESPRIIPRPEGRILVSDVKDSSDRKISSMYVGAEQCQYQLGWRYLLSGGFRERFI